MSSINPLIQPLAALCLVIASIGCSDPMDEPPAPEPPIHTPRWAFEPWISKDISSTDDTRSFVEGFRSRGIPVGVVVLDSPWETNYNTFVPHPERYHDFGTLVRELKDQRIRVVLWITQMVNESSFDSEPGASAYEPNTLQYETARVNGYFVNDAAQYFWWKGVGSGLDFFNPDATRWWHGLQAPLFDHGISGFKLDFGESYVSTPTVSTLAGVVDHQTYSEAYYRDFYVHGVRTRGADEFVTMVRPYDESYQFQGRFFARKEHAPVGWVGDNRRDFVGMEDSLDHMFRSAAAGYVVVGSDIGGYLDRDDRDLLRTIPFDAEVLMRWIALGALTPFMQLHGRANLEPWAVPDRASEVVATYRYFANLHHELVPFFYSLAEEAYAEGGSILRPRGEGPEDWRADYRFELGEALLVAPVLSSTSAREVRLPAGSTWIDWWDFGRSYEGGTTIESYDVGDPGRIPVFIREGAIIPMSVSSTITGFSTRADRPSALVLAVPGVEPTRFELHEEDGELTAIQLGSDSIQLSRVSRDSALAIRLDQRPPVVEGAGDEQPDRATIDDVDRGWFWEASRKLLWVRLAPGAGAQVRYR
ncbi:MAG: glycoside hydrolase family 31 protein [Deltaproteobacteria bacterium]|nr:glycoside hydrolase family 31 protein [Deltaproteobacteria bacterium]